MSAILAILSVLGWSWEALRTIWKHFAASWGGLGGLLERLGAPLGGSWDLLSASWEPLGASWAPLGGILGASWAHLTTFTTTFKRRTYFEPNRGGTIKVFELPEGAQNRPKMGPKTKQNLRRFSRATKLLSKSLLEPSWADLGAFWKLSWAPIWRSGTRRRVFGEKSRFGC